MDSMQASLEAEAKAKAEALRQKKKLESDINELEISLDHSSKAHSEMQKAFKKLQTEFKDMELKVEDQHRIASEYREQLGISDRRGNALQGELEETRSLLEQSDRARRQAEADLGDAQEQLGQLNSQCSNLTLARRKLEGEMQTLQVSTSFSFCKTMCTYAYLGERRARVKIKTNLYEIPNNLYNHDRYIWNRSKR